MRPTHRRLAATAAGLAVLPVALFGCGIGGGSDDDDQAAPERAPAEEAATRSRERVQAYLDAMTAKDAAAGRSQLCAVLQDGFDVAATGPNGDFADHFEVPQATITDVRSGPRGQEVSATVSVTAGKRKATRALVFTVTRDGGDWCISGEAPTTAPPSGGADAGGGPGDVSPSPRS
ncbi:hypothetical protein ACFOW4_16320 [Micromonospora sp. GCM10011542]|uniref:hypothetical protein n=1 Tax=Micromonospora sp. GCM10011542 TaxID=3317337 RepID=UPI00360E32F8